MSGTRRDYKTRNQYNKIKKNKRKTDESKTAIIVKYVIYLILILIASIIIGWFLSKNTDGNKTKQDTQNEEINKINENKTNSKSEIKSFLIINVSENEDYTSTNYALGKEIIAYYLFFYYEKEISYIVMPPSMELSDGNILHRRVTKTRQYENLYNNIKNQFQFLSGLGFAVVDYDLINDISTKFNRAEFFTQRGSQLISINRDAYNYQKFKKINNNSSKNEIFNYIAYHSFFIKELLLNYHFILSNYKQNMLILNRAEKLSKDNLFIAEIMNALSRRNIKYINQAYEVDETGYIVMKKENSKNLFKNITNKKNTKEKIKISIVNGTSKQFNPNKIINYFKTNYDLTVSEYKNGNITDKTRIINWNKNIKYSLILSEYMNYIPVCGSIFNHKNDFQLILYLGQNYETYINLKN